MADNQQQGNPGQGNPQKAQTIQWKNAPIAAQAGAEVLTGTPVTGSDTMSGWTPLYDAQTGGFAGWQDPKGQNFQGYNGMYENYNTRTGQLYAQPTYQQPQQPQQQQQQGPSLASMWQQYMSQGAQQAQPQQPAAAATITPITPYQGQQLGTATPYATISQAQTPSPFAPPPPPAPGQGQGQQWQPPQQQQWPQVQRFQQGGPVLSQDQQNQLYNQGQAPGNDISSLYPTYGLSAIGALGGPMVINPTPNQGHDGMTKGGVYAGPQRPTVYGNQVAPSPSVVPGSLGQYTFPGGGQLTQAQMAQFMNGTPEQQATVAQALGTTPGAIMQAAQTYQGTGPQGQFTVPNAPVQHVFSSANQPGGAQLTQPGLFVAANMPTPSGAGNATITPTTPANAAQARPGGTGVPWATVPGPGQTPIPPSSVMPPPMMMPGGGMFGVGMGGQPPPVPGGPGGVANYAAGGVGIQSPAMEAHNDALAKAGMTLYAHYGGDPSTASPADIVNFYGQLTAHIGGGNASGGSAGGAVTALGAGGSTPSGPMLRPAIGLPGNLPGISGGPPAFGSAPVTPPAVTPPKRMATGGLVPGRGNTDKVPALLTPGEYVLNRQQTAQLFGGRTPIRMQSGGPVPDDNEPPEVRRQPLTVPTAGTEQATPQTQPGPSQTTSASAPDDQSHPGYPSAAAARAALTSGGASGGGYNIPANLGGGYIGASPGTGQSGYAYPNQAAATAAGDVGTGVTGGGGANIGGAVSTLASGLASAAKTYADSIKSWQMLPNAIPNPTKNQAAPVQLAQQQAQRPPQNQYNPYSPSMMGIA